MPRVLMISYIFPPMGGVGVQRTLKFVKYLPENGWNPQVLTVKTPRFTLLDEDLLTEIPNSIAITRTHAALLPHQIPWRIRELISRWILIVDEQVGWYPFATSAGRQIIHENPVDIIYSSSSPYTSHLIARQLAIGFQLPWVADFRDPWVGNSNLRFPTRLHRNMTERLERQVLQDASHVLVVSPPMKQSFCDRYPSLDPAKFTWLPNGFDGEDFVDVHPMPRDKDRFTLVYTGSFYTQGRTAKFILEAVEAAIRSGTIPRERIRLRMVGNTGKTTRETISALHLDDVVEVPGFVSHGQSIAHLMAADVLLLIIGDAADASAVFTGKVFEYLAANKPILCLANEGVAADLVRRTRVGIVVPPVDVPQISYSLHELYQQWQSGRLTLDPDRQLIETFERRQLTAQLAGIFDTLTRSGAS